jgi:hypothetical protein
MRRNLMGWLPSVGSLDPGDAPRMVDYVVERGRRERAQEAEVWP